MTAPLEFGLDTFGDVTRNASGSMLPHAQAIRNVVDEAVLADELGLDFIGLGEHHRADFAISSPETVLAAIASRTRRIHLGSAVTVLSSDDPIRVFQRFATLDALEDRLAGRRYLTGETITEADWRLFTTLVRFDAVYVGHFKCNIRRIADYPNLSAYLRDLYQVPGVAETVNLHHIKTHYYRSHLTINPTGIVPAGPTLDFAAPHGRERLLAA